MWIGKVEIQLIERSNRVGQAEKVVPRGLLNQRSYGGGNRSDRWRSNKRCQTDEVMARGLVGWWSDK